MTGAPLYELYHLTADYDRNYTFLAFAVGKKCVSFSKHLILGGEGQFVKHFGGRGQYEWNVLLVEHWLTFPWNHIVRTSIALGQGVSYATEIPEIEEQSYEKTAQFLGYLLFEATFSLSQYSRWNIVARIHHRSGASGFFSGVNGASNAFGIGVSYSF